MRAPTPWFRAAVLAASALLTGAVLVVAQPAAGSAPNAGTLTTTSGAKTWTGGPFVAPNATGNAGTVDCSAPQSCDDYTLTVDTPAGTGDTQNLKITTSWTTPGADFDVYVLDAAGNA